MQRYCPKSQTLQLGAVFLWLLCLLGIRQNMGLDLEKGGAALAVLLCLAVAGHLTTGKRIEVDRAGGDIRSMWVLGGVPMGRNRRKVDDEGIKLRPEWMRSLWEQDGSVKGIQKALVYDLALVGQEKGPEGASCDTTIDLKEDQVLFTLAECRARAVAEELKLPVAVRWDRLYDDISCDSREYGDWHRRYLYPQQMKEWRKWLSW